MIDEKYIDLVTAYLQDTLSSGERERLNELIDQGEIDVLDIKEMEKLFEHMGTLPAPEPDAALSDRFYSMLELEKEKNRRQRGSLTRLLGDWSKRLREGFELRRVGYAAMIFLLGMLAGDVFAPVTGQDEQIERLSAEMSRMREIMMITLLDNNSPTERLKAVNISTEIRSVDGRVIDALLQTLKKDPNVNVRIAAVDALVRHGDNPKVRAGLVSNISTQESPIVQAALADAMLALQEKRSVDEFRKLLEQNGLDEHVRNKLENTIAALN